MNKISTNVLYNNTSLYKSEKTLKGDKTDVIINDINTVLELVDDTDKKIFINLKGYNQFITNLSKEYKKEEHSDGYKKIFKYYDRITFGN